MVKKCYPEGDWECTNSTFRDFVVGKIYQCKMAGDGYRIYPKEGAYWAPYWSWATQRFCYPRDQLDFKYLGPKEAKREVVMTISCNGQPDKVVVNGVTYITGELNLGKA